MAATVIRRLYFVLVGESAYHGTTLAQAIEKARLKGGDRFVKVSCDTVRQDLFEMIDGDPTHIRPALDVPPKQRYNPIPRRELRTSPTRLPKYER